jgi:hypothetical protein
MLNLEAISDSQPSGRVPEPGIGGLLNGLEMFFFTFKFTKFDIKNFELSHLWDSNWIRLKQNAYLVVFKISNCIFRE